MQATQASSSNDMTGSTFHSISSLYQEYLQRNFPIFLGSDSGKTGYRCVFCIIVGQNTPQLHANKWSKVSASPLQKRHQIGDISF